MAQPFGRAARARAFSLIELLVVISIISLLLAILLPSLSRARRSARGAACGANLRNLSLAQANYANAHKDLLVMAGDGSFNAQGSWIGLLEKEGTETLSRRCPADQSIYFDELFTAFDPPVYRLTSYGINNYVSPTHLPLGGMPVKKLSQIQRPSVVIQFTELAEDGNYAIADHLHVQEFFNPLTPQLTPQRVNNQMPLGRHGGKAKDWTGVVNYSFFDGHAEPLPLRSAYENPSRNRFNPALAP